MSGEAVRAPPPTHVVGRAILCSSCDATRDGRWRGAVSGRRGAGRARRAFTRRDEERWNDERTSTRRARGAAGRGAHVVVVAGFVRLRERELFVPRRRRVARDRRRRRRHRDGDASGHDARGSRAIARDSTRLVEKTERVGSIRRAPASRRRDARIGRGERISPRAARASPRRDGRRDRARDRATTRPASARARRVRLNASSIDPNWSGRRREPTRARADRGGADRQLKVRSFDQTKKP